jgi:hypothetical protein
MIYCAVANLGLGYKPQVEGKKLDLEVMAQHGNNLILRDNATGEPLQQILGIREGENAGMSHWPTFRMTARGFAKAYPQGEVFINVPPKNPLLWIFDKLIDTIFASEIGRQHREAAPIMDTMTRYDNRLHNKTYVWGIEIGGDAVCWTDDFAVAQGNIVNATVGGTAVVVAWDSIYESLGVYYNHTGAPVQSIDFFGKTDSGETLPRVETLRPGMFWHVWAEFFPKTEINRVGEKASAQAA